jgi:hypothetical protein
MRLADLATLPLRWSAVRSPAIRALLLKERLRSGLAVDLCSAINPSGRLPLVFVG